MLLALLGLSPGADIIAHLGGFGTGLAFGVVLALMPKVTREPRVNFCCGVVFTVLVVWTWSLALNAGRLPTL
jgi:hypothetical protein